MEVKKLLVFHPAIAPYRLDLLNRLNSEFKADFYFYRRNITSQKFDQVALQKELSFKPGFLNFGFPLGYKDRVLRFGILHKILKHKPDIILCSEFSITTLISIFYAKLLLPKSKTFTLCDDSLEIAKDCKGLRKLARKLATRFIDGVILCNAPTKEWYNENFTDLNTYTFPIIQDEMRLRSSVESIKHIAKEYKKNKNIITGNTFLYVGRLSPEKNLQLLISAFGKYLNNNDGTLILVGDGEQKDELIHKCDALNISEKVIFPGRYEGPELYAWYMLADWFILPSTYEPFGAVVNEALIFGLPVLCSTLAGASCLINDQNGTLFNPYDENKLVELLGSLSLCKQKNENLMALSFSTEIVSLVRFLNQ